MEGLSLPWSWILEWQNWILLVLQLYCEAWNTASWSSQRRESSGVFSANECLDVGWSLEPMFCHITLLLDQSLIMPWECWHLPSHEAQKPPDQRPGSLCRSLMCNLLRLPCAVTGRESHSGLAIALAAALLWLSFLHCCHSRRLVCLLPGSSSLLDPSHPSPQGIHPFSWLSSTYPELKGRECNLLSLVSPLPRMMYR